MKQIISLLLVFLLTLSVKPLKRVVLSISKENIKPLYYYHLNNTQIQPLDVDEQKSLDYDESQIYVKVHPSEKSGHFKSSLFTSSEEEPSKTTGTSLKGGLFELKETYQNLDLSDEISSFELYTIQGKSFGPFKLEEIEKKTLSHAEEKIRPELITFHNNGNRITLVYLSSGYTSGQKNQFVQDCQKNINYLRNTVEPFKTYFNLMSIYGVYEPSVQPGASHPDRGDNRNTNLKCTYNYNNTPRLLVCDNREVVRLASYAPRDDMRVAIINDPRYGGSGSSVVGTTYNGPEMIRVAVHEMGHSKFNLADEYSYGTTGSTRSPNCHTSNTNLPWQHLVGRDPEIGAFRVCSYTNLWRPTNNGCLMNILQDKYCAVCREHIIKMLRSSTLVKNTCPQIGEGVHEKIALKVNEELEFEMTKQKSNLKVKWDWKEPESGLTSLLSNVMDDHSHENMKVISGEKLLFKSNKVGLHHIHLVVEDVNDAVTKPEIRHLDVEVFEESDFPKCTIKYCGQKKYCIIQ